MIVLTGPGSMGAEQLDQCLLIDSLNMQLCSATMEILAAGKGSSCQT